MGWWNFWRSRSREQDLDDELSHDFAATVDEGIRNGLPPIDAERVARREFGDRTVIKEHVHEVWGLGRAERFWQDVRYGLRGMQRTPGLTTVIVLTLMLGIGANAVVFSVIDAVLLKPLPYRDPSRLIYMSGHALRFAPFDSIDAAELQDWKRQARSFESMVGYFALPDIGTIRADSFDVGVAYVVGDVPGFLGVSPTVGRGLAAEGGQPVSGSAPRQVALISEALFRERLGGDPAALGNAVLVIGKVPYTVIGVLPRDRPLALPGSRGSTVEDRRGLLLKIDVVVDWGANQTARPTEVLARLKLGASLEAARSEVSALHSSYIQQHPDRPKSELRMMPLQDRVVGDTRLALLVLWTAVGFVLLVACTNVTNLLLARSAARSREMSMRAALGASRGRLIRQLLTESVVLAVAGGAAGLILAWWGARLVVSQVAVDIPRLKEAVINWQVLAFCLALCTGTGVLAGLAPALGASRQDRRARNPGRMDSSAFARRHRLHGVFVVSELAVALVLLTGAGLMLKSLWVIRSQTSVFAPEHVLEIKINARQIASPDHFLDALVEQIEALPGVQAAAAFTQAGLPLKVVGLAAPASSQTAMLTVLRVTPHYKTSSGAQLLSGRWLTDEDWRGLSRVAVVNDSLVRMLLAQYPDAGSIIGRQIDLGGNAADNPTVVGVVSSLQRRADADPEPRMFVPSSWWPLNGIAQYLVRTSGDPLTLVRPIQKIVSRTPSVEMRGAETAEDDVASGLAPRRLQTNLLVAFAGLALLLAMAGAYGVLSYGVAERTSEFGVRLAIGARRRDVLYLVLGRAARLAGLGIGVGLVASAAFSRLIISLLYGVVPTDAWTYGAVSLILFLVSMLAAYLPALRATRVDPIVALRYE